MKKSKNRPKLRKSKKLWSPSKIDNIQWFNTYSDLSIVKTNDKVYKWLDKSGNGNHLQSKNKKGIKYEKD
jgi:hypothetical protein